MVAYKDTCSTIQRKVIVTSTKKVKDPLHPPQVEDSPILHNKTMFNQDSDNECSKLLRPSDPYKNLIKDNICIDFHHYS